MSDAQHIKLSRVGKLPVSTPKGVTITISGNHVQVKGPRGEMSRELPVEVTVGKDGEDIVIQPVDASRRARSMQGLARSIVQNMVTGVSEGFSRRLEINGVGYRADLRGKGHLFFLLGYSHPI